MDISSFSTLAGVPPTVLAVETQRFDFEEIRDLANAIRKGIFDRADKHLTERERIEWVLFHSSRKSIEDQMARSKCFTELQELAAVLHKKYERTKDAEDKNMSVFVEDSCLSLSATNGPPFNLLISLCERHNWSQSPEDLERVIKSLQQVVEVLEDSNPAKPIILQSLAGYLTMRYDSVGAIEDLDEAIKSGQHAVRLSDADDIVAPKLFNNLQAAYHRRFQHSGDMDDLDAVVINGYCAAEVMKDEDPGMQFIFSNFAEYFHSQYNLSQATEDLRRYAKNLQASVAMVSDGSINKPEMLDRLGRIFNVLHTKTGVLEDIDQAIQNEKHAVSLTDDAHSSRPEWLTTLGNSFFLRFKLSGSLEDLDQAIERTIEAVTLMPNEGSTNTERLRYLANYFRIRYQHTGETGNSAQAIEYEQQAASQADRQVEVHSSGLLECPLMPSIMLAAPENLRTCHTSRHLESKKNTNTISGLDEVTLLALQQLSRRFQEQFNQTGNFADLEKSIKFHRQVLHLAPQTHPCRVISLNNIACALFALFEQKGNLGDLEEVIKFHRLALSLISDPHPDRSISFNNLANALYLRFQQKGSLGDLEESIKLHRQAVDLTPLLHPDRSSSLSNLANGLCSRFEQNGDFEDLEESIKFHKQAFDLTPHESFLLHNFAHALSMRFKQKGKIDDLEESIRFNRQALNLRPVPHPLRSSSLNNLASALSTQFQQKGDLGDLEESIRLYRQALDLRPHPHPDQSSSLNNLANAIFAQFKQKGDFEDLEESIKFHRQSLDLFPIPHPNRFSSLGNLAYALSTRFEQKGDLGDLVESIKLHRQAQVLRPHPHPLQSFSLNNLAHALSTRFQQKEDYGDLEESIKLLRHALELTPVLHPLQIFTLNNLGNVLYLQFKHKGDLKDLEESIKFYRQVLYLIPEHHSLQSELLHNLAVALSTQFEQKRDLGDLEESIKYYRQALHLMPALHPGQSGLLSCFAIALCTQFEQKGDIEDLQNSIKFHRQALELMPHPHPGRSGLMYNLAKTLSIQFEQKGDLGDLEECVAICQEGVVSELSPVTQRLQISRLWAQCADSHKHTSALEAYRSAISLLPHLASLDKNLQQRQEALMHARGLACNAASCAIQNNKMELAVEFLSAGRSVFWTQALNLRTPLDDLASVHPELAQKLHSISSTLESASIKGYSNSNSLSSRQKMDIEDQLSQYWKLNDEWICTLNKVRQIGGFEDFLQPMPFSKLCQCANNGPVVLLNATKLGCDALIVTLDGVKHVPLPKMNFLLAVLLQKGIQRSLQQDNTHFDDMSGIIEVICGYANEHGLRGPEYGQSPEAIFEIVLGCLWNCIVHPVITELQLQKSESPNNRLWWCPTGPFVFLPIHAAGVYNYGETECMSNYCIPSYSSTLQDLLVPATSPDSSFKMLAVIQPQTPGYQDLPGTIQELKRIEEHVPQPHDQYLVKLGDELPATVAEVLKHLPNCSIVHFGCHGFQDPDKPLNSGLHLQDGQLKISKVIECHIPKASLAYLSACETAKGDASAPDEAMHIAATMIFAGFHGVVGTMWPIADDDGPKVADVFYRCLFQHGSHPDCTAAARALHMAVRELRDHDERISFHHWVPFVHYGI